MTEIYEIVNGVDPLIMNSLFGFQNNKYSIRNFQVLSFDFRKTVNNAFKTVTSPSIWAKLPSEYKVVASREGFKVKSKKWKCYTCPWKLCKKFQPNLGFFN